MACRSLLFLFFAFFILFLGRRGSGVTLFLLTIVAGCLNSVGFRSVSLLLGWSHSLCARSIGNLTRGGDAEHLSGAHRVASQVVPTLDVIDADLIFSGDGGECFTRFDLVRYGLGGSARCLPYSGRWGGGCSLDGCVVSGGLIVID